jgi:hypothetical protein
MTPAGMVRPPRGFTRSLIPNMPGNPSRDVWARASGPGISRTSSRYCFGRKGAELAGGDKGRLREKRELTGVVRLQRSARRPALEYHERDLAPGALLVTAVPGIRGDRFRPKALTLLGRGDPSMDATTLRADLHCCVRIRS